MNILIEIFYCLKVCDNVEKIFSSVAICSLGLFTSAVIGRLGDTKSRKAALLIPFTGLVLEGISLVVQSYYMEVSDVKNLHYLNDLYFIYRSARLKTFLMQRLIAFKVNDVNQFQYQIFLTIYSIEFQLSVYWLVGSEALFAAFGGYMSIFSSFFAYATDSVCNSPPKYRSLVIAVLEGVIGFGGKKFGLFETSVLIQI